MRGKSEENREPILASAYLSRKLTRQTPISNNCPELYSLILSKLVYPLTQNVHRARVEDGRLLPSTKRRATA
jgi:hypothetical protein